MVTTRVIRIDEEVWVELQRRAVPFEDNPNSVIRKLLSLPAVRTASGPIDSENKMDERVSELVGIVEGAVGEALAFPPVPRIQYVRFDGLTAKVRAYIYPQKRRLKIETSRQMAEGVGIYDWDYELKNGWFNTGIPSVYWYAPDGEKAAYRRAANVLAELYKS